MNPFDASILHFLNGFAHQWWALDDFVVWVTRDSFQKGGVIALLLWWAWFTADERLETGREKIVCTALAAPCALVFSRIFSEILPFRTRPMHVPELHLQ